MYAKSDGRYATKVAAVLSLFAKHTVPERFGNGIRLYTGCVGKRQDDRDRRRRCAHKNRFVTSRRPKAFPYNTVVDVLGGARNRAGRIKNGKTICHTEKSHYRPRVGRASYTYIRAWRINRAGPTAYAVARSDILLSYVYARRRRSQSSSMIAVVVDRSRRRSQSPSFPPADHSADDVAGQ